MTCRIINKILLTRSPKTGATPCERSSMGTPVSIHERDQEGAVINPNFNYYGIDQAYGAH